MHYYLAPYEWRDIGGMMGFAAPIGAVGSVDLRTLGQQGGAGVESDRTDGGKERQISLGCLND